MTTTAGTEKWRAKNLYLTFHRNTKIWGINAFKDLGQSEKCNRGSVPCPLIPEVVCKFNVREDPRFSKEKKMHVFQLDDTAYLISGTPDAPKSLLDDGFRVLDIKNLYLPVYEFTNSPLNNPKLVTPSKLPDKLSMPSLLPDAEGYVTEHPDGMMLDLPELKPMILKIKGGDVYMLLEGHGEIAFALDMSNSFQVLRRDDSSENSRYKWTTLAIPIFYDSTKPEFDEYHNHSKSYVGVLANRLCMAMPSGLTYQYNAETQVWDKAELSCYFPCLSIALSGLVPKIREEEEEDNDSSIVISGGLYQIHWGQGNLQLFASLFDGKGKRHGIQDISRVLSGLGLGNSITCFKVMELEGAGLSSTFCVVVTTAERLLGLSVVRVSLSPSFVRKNESAHVDKKVKLSQQDTTSSTSGSDKDMISSSPSRGEDDGGEADDKFLEVRVVEERVYDMNDPDAPPCIINSAFFC